MQEKIKLDIPLLLPDVPDERDKCVQRLIDGLVLRRGVEEAHVVEAKDGEPARLCIHFDAQTLSLPEIRQIATRMGGDLTNHFGHAVWKVDGIRHPRRARTITSQLRRTPGVIDAEATAGGFVRIEFERSLVDEAALRTVLNRIRVDVRDSAPTESDWADGAGKGLRLADDHGHDHDHGDRPRDTSVHASPARPESAEQLRHAIVHTDGPGSTMDADHGHAHEPAGHKKDSGHAHHHGGIFGEQSELIFGILSGVFLLAGWIIDTATDAPDSIPLVGYLLAYFFGGYFTIREAFESIRLGHFEIDFLMLVAAAGAAALGAWTEGALLLFLFSIGHALESYAMGRARKAIEALAELSPKTATVLRNGTEMEIAVDELILGDLVIVRTNSRLPADGFVVKGSSTVNEAPITGESIPVDKKPVSGFDGTVNNDDATRPQHRVFAGTINGSGSLEIIVSKLASDSTMARIVQMVAEAETQQSPTQRFTNKFERVFVPTILALVVLLLFAWVVIDETFSSSFYRAMAVLVAASPCALAIATPSAVLSGIARAGRSGVLIKGGGPLERLGTLTSIAFDKTGTLTKGEPTVTDIAPSEGVSTDELLRTIVSVEKLSDHPIAAAVVAFGLGANGLSDPEKQSLESAQALESVTGKGIKAEINGEAVQIGNKELFSMSDGPAPGAEILDTVDRLEHAGRTTMIVRRGDKYLGVVGLMDSPRENAESVIQTLRRIGIRRMVMISGDNQRVADAIATAVGLDEAYGSLLPEQKVDAIKSLSKDGNVAMVGDGVNDAPAMANAAVGIAMGAAGSDVALETADVALMGDDLQHLPFAVGLSRKASQIIRQNLWMSLGMVAFLVPATLFGLGIGPAVALHEGSTLVVVINALRLLGFNSTAL